MTRPPPGPDTRVPVHTRLLLRGFQSLRNLVRPDLGPLEHRVMEALWRRGEANVRDVHEEFGDGIAYTTVMTTLDRLYKKGLLTRWKVGRAFQYAPAATREESQRTSRPRLLEGLLAQHGHEPLPLLSNLVDAVGDADQRLLDDLERLVQEKRDRLRDGGRREVRAARPVGGADLVPGDQHRGLVVAASVAWFATRRWGGRHGTRPAGWLALRLMPSVAAGVFLLIAFGPAYLRFEPRDAY